MSRSTRSISFPMREHMGDSPEPKVPWGKPKVLETRRERTHRGGEAWRFRTLLLRTLENQRTETRHGTGAGALTFFIYRKLAGGEILQAEEGELEAILDS